MQTQHKRILLKISGEALAGNLSHGYDKSILQKVTSEIATAVKSGIQVALVIGGGNFWRGRQDLTMDRSSADYMGMLATLMNAICVQNALEAQGIPTLVQSAIYIDKVAKPFNKREAVEALDSGKVVIFGGGTGSPFFSTDTTASLRSAEIDADLLLFAKNVDGVYDSDPAVNPSAKRYEVIPYLDFVTQGLKAMDTTAVIMCKENNIPVYVFGLNGGEGLADAIMGNLPSGTWIK